MFITPFESTKTWGKAFLEIEHQAPIPVPFRTELHRLIIKP